VKNSLKNTIKKKFYLNKKKLFEQPLSVIKKINIEKLTKITTMSLTEKYKKFKEKIKKKEEKRIELLKKDKKKE